MFSVTVVHPILVHRMFVIATTDHTGDNAVFEGDHELASGGALSPSGDNITGIMTGSDELQGQCYYKEADDFTQGEPLLIVPGERFVMRMAVNVTVGTGIAGIEFENLPVVASNRKRKQSDGSIVTVPLLGNYTKVTA